MVNDRELLASIGMTEKEADARAEEYENDSWDAASLSKPHRGRPSLANESVKPYTVRFPVSLMAYVDECAQAHGWTRSEELRRMVADARDRASVE